MAGLRLIVTQYVDNEALCFLMEGHKCDDMASVRHQNRDLHDLQDYIDGQSGGPGQGFFQIVTNPFQARQVINQGKLAVVEGIEVSDVLGCEGTGRPGCTDARIGARLDEIQRLGVSTFFPIHKFDNAVGGTKMDVGSTGLLINIANSFETNHFWDVQPCPGGAATQERDSQQLSNQGLSPVLQTMINVVFWPLGPSPPITGVSPPHCNGLGLTPKGAYVISEMIRRHLIVELDHMDVKTADAALSIIEGRHYSGVISAHGWDTPADNRRISAVGGLVTPSAHGVPGNFVQQWRIDRANPHPGFRFGFGYGSDMNGLSPQTGATSGGQGKERINYPFKSFDGNVTFKPEQWGFKTFNIDTDGVANYGLYADWLEAVRVNAGADGQVLMSDMFNGAEGYLQMWERASGVPATRCLPDHQAFTATGLGTTIVLGDTAERLLPRSGQPSSRPGRSYRYCIGAAGAAGGSVSALFAPDNTVGLIAASAPGIAAGGLWPGLPETLLKGHAVLQTAGLWLGPTLPGGARYLYGTSSGRITYVGLAQSQETVSAAHLRDELRQAGF
jgi:hypothetical protein